MPNGGVKHHRKVKTPEGKEIEQTDYFYGYKAHVSMNAEIGLISNLETRPGGAFDGHLFLLSGGQRSKTILTSENLFRRQSV